MKNIPDFTPYFKGTNFGHTDYNAIILEGLMKVSCEYANGHTLNIILTKLGYIKPTQVRNVHTTDLGKKVMYELYEELKKRAAPVHTVACALAEDAGIDCFCGASDEEE